MSPAVEGVLLALADATIAGVSKALATNDLREALLASAESLASAAAKEKFPELVEP